MIAAPAELAHLRSGGLSALGYVANWGQIFSHQSPQVVRLARAPVPTANASIGAPVGVAAG